MDRLIQEISQYEVDETTFRKSCCTAWDLCDHTITIKIPQELWLQLKVKLQNVCDQKRL